MKRVAVGVAVAVGLTAGSLWADHGLWISHKSGKWSDTANWAGGTVASGTSQYCRIAEYDQDAEGSDNPLVITLDKDYTVRYVVSSNSNVRIEGTKTLSFKPNSAGTSTSRGGFQIQAPDKSFDIRVKLKTALSGKHGVVFNPMSGTAARNAGRTYWNVPSFTATYPTSHYLRNCHGTLVVDDPATLSFVTNAYNLQLGPGALLYRGDSFELKGLTTTDDNELASSRKFLAKSASVLDIEKPTTTVTLLSAETETLSGVALFKAGAGTLYLKGTGDFTIGGSAGAGYSASTAGRYPNGDGPGSGYLGLNVAEGKIVIGTKDDPTDAPNVIAPAGIAVGPRSHQASYGVQTTGELVMNNGTLTIPADSSDRIYVGFYAGSPEIGDSLHPRLTLNGGLIQMISPDKGFFLGHNDGKDDSNASAELVVNGGAIHIASGMQFAYAAGDCSKTNVSTVTMNGGEIVLGKYARGGNWKEKSMPFRFYGNGGRFETTAEVDLNYNNSTDDGYFGEMTLGENFTLKTPELSATKSVGTSVSFDGTTWEQPAGKATILTNIVTATVGTKGLTLVTAKNGATAADFVLAQSVGGTGDINAEGDGLVVFPTAFAASTGTGAIVARNGGRVRGDGETLAGRAVRIAPGSGLRVAAGDVSKVGDLTLGAAGATEPARLEFSTAGDIGTLVVEGELNVLSPVEFDLATTDGADARLSPDDGVCTSLVYSASTSVDPSLFRLNPAHAASKILTAEEVTIEDGPLAGRKAIVCTVVPNGPAPEWSATTAGGAWTVLANWDNANYYPNAQGASAPFRAAEAAAVPVTVDQPVTVGEMTFAKPEDDAFGYALSGSAVTIDAGETTVVPLVTVEGGAHAVGALSVPGEVTVVTTNGSSIALDALSGAGAVSVNPSGSAGVRGTVRVGDTSGFAGSVSAARGLLELADLSFVKDASDLSTGYGTLRYTGPSAAIAGLTIGSGASQRTCVIDTANDLFVSNVVNTGKSDYAGILKVGAGNLTIGGKGTLTLNSYSDHNAGSTDQETVLPNGDSPDSTFRMIQCSEGSLTFGVKDDPAHAPTIFEKRAGGVGVGCPEMRGDCMISFDNGIVTNTASIHAGYYWPRSNKDCAEMTMTIRWRGGKTFGTNLYGLYFNNQASYGYGNVDFLMDAGEADFSENCYLSHAKLYAGCWSRLVITGGRMTFGGDFYASCPTKHRGADILIAVGPGELSVGGTIDLWRMTTPESTTYKAQIIDVWANPDGIIRFGALTRSANGISGYGVGENVGGDLYGNGGVLVPTAAGSLATLAHVYASTNGLVFSTAELPADVSYEIAQSVASDPALVAANATDGGLIKKGAGTLTLSAANVYTGDTTVEDGVLAFADDAAIPTTLVLKPGAAFAKTGDWTLGKSRVFLDVGADDPEIGATYELGTVTGALAKNEIRIRKQSGERKVLRLSLEDGKVAGTVDLPGGVILLVR